MQVSDSIYVKLTYTYQLARLLTFSTATGSFYHLSVASAAFAEVCLSLLGKFLERIKTITPRPFAWLLCFTRETGNCEMTEGLRCASNKNNKRLYFMKTNRANSWTPAARRSAHKSTLTFWSNNGYFNGPAKIYLWQFTFIINVSSEKRWKNAETNKGKTGRIQKRHTIKMQTLPSIVDRLFGRPLWRNLTFMMWKDCHFITDQNWVGNNCTSEQEKNRRRRPKKGVRRLRY